jgi:P4 family phage/plasmid primase-like protien
LLASCSVIQRMVDHLRARLKELRTQPKSYEGGLRVFPRNDDVLLASEVCDLISNRQHPGVYADGDFWVYNEHSGAWELLERVDVRRATMGLSGARIFVKTVKEKDDNGNEVERIVTEALNLSSQRVKGLASLVEDMLAEETHFHHAPQGLAFNNGFAVATTHGVVLERKAPAHRARNAIDMPWRRSTAPKWDVFLNDVFRDDADRQQKKMFLQEFIGTCLIGDATFKEKCCICYGGGSNGKSVFLDVIQSLFPESGIAAVPPQNWDNEYYRARLKGVQLNIVSELPKREIIDSPAVNAILSGERIEARSPAEKPFNYRPRAGHLFAVNPPMPAAGDLSPGFWRRYVMVTFNRSFETDPVKREKKGFIAELQQEKAGILSWAMDGACRVKKQGSYTEVPSSGKYLDEWRTGSDQVAMFVRETCVALEPAYADRMWTADELFHQYRRWADRTGHRMPVSLSRFCERLTLLGHTERQHGARRVRPLQVVTMSDRPPPGPSYEAPESEPPSQPLQAPLFEEDE